MHTVHGQLVATEMGTIAAVVRGRSRRSMSPRLGQQVTAASGALLIDCSSCQGVVTDPSPQSAQPPPSQDGSGQQPLPVENAVDHTTYSYQQQTK